MSIALRRGLVALPLLGGLLVAAVLAGRESLRPRADFVFCNQNEVGSLDPARITATSELRIVSALFEGLVRPDPETGGPLPGQALSWETSPDGLRWSFALRDDIRWTDGTPLTAEDFRWSLLRVLHPDTAAPYANLLWCLRGAREFTRARQDGREPDPDSVGVRAPARDRLEFELLSPVPHLTELLLLPAFLPVPRHAVERHGAAWSRADNLVSNGPFRLVEHRLRDVLRLEKWDGYWGAEDVALRSVDALAADGTTTQLNLYLTGAVDWMIRPPAALHSALQARADLRRGDQAGTTFLRFNLTRPPFDDLRVRRALALVLDREALARDVLRGGERGATGFVPDLFPGYQPPRLPPHDPVLARELLAQAGFPGGQGFPSFELLYPHNEPARDLSEAVAAAWRTELGLQPRLVNQAFKVFLDSCRNLAYDTAWSAWTADYLDPSSFLDCFLGDSGNNRTGFRDADYERLLAAAAATPDRALRLATLSAAEARLLELLPVAPICFRANVNLVAPAIRGFHDNALDVHPLRDLSRVSEGGR